MTLLTLNSRSYLRVPVAGRLTRPRSRSMAGMQPRAAQSVWELTTRKNDVSFDRIFEVYSCEASCAVGKTLSTKYGSPLNGKHREGIQSGVGVNEDNRQMVMSIQNRFSHEQTWFNAARANKPQNFISTDALIDPTSNGRRCDFCDVYQLTAIDSFGRVDKGSVVSGSNLFKYCAPGHGVLVMKRHHPLEFEMEDTRDLMLCAQEWLDKAAMEHPEAGYPLFVWNCLARAGASQFHGHAQVMLSQVPFPCYTRMKATQQSYATTFMGRQYLDDLFEAYSQLGLLSTVGKGLDKCVIYSSLTPWKDMEVIIRSSAITHPTFYTTLYNILYVLMTEFGMRTFNVGIHGMSLPTTSAESHPSQSANVVARSSHYVHTVVDHVSRVASRGQLSSQASDFGGLEVFGGASIGHTDPFEIARAIKRQLSLNS